MKHYLFLLLFLLPLTDSSAQNKNTWHVIWNEDSTLFGFKNQHNEVKIEPRLERGLFGQINRFDDVIALWRKKNEKKYE